MSYERAAEIAGKAAYTSAGGTFVAGLTLSEWAAVVGIFATVITTLLNWYYKQKSLDLAREQLNATAEDEDL